MVSQDVGGVNGPKGHMLEYFICGVNPVDSRSAATSGLGEGVEAFTMWIHIPPAIGYSEFYFEE